MLSSVLIVSSTRAHVDAVEILRIQDTAAAILKEGVAVDVLVPRLSPLLTAGMPSGVRLFTAPKIPFCGNLPSRPSLRRHLMLLVLFFRCVSLVTGREYTLLHGFNDGVIVARAADRVTVHKYPYVGEMHSPLSSRGLIKGICGVFARFLERGALRHADAIITPAKEILDVYNGRIPMGRVSEIPDPRVEFAPDTFTYGEFAHALRHVYDYVLRPKRET